MYKVNLNENIFLGQPEKKNSQVVPFNNQVLEAPSITQMCNLVKDAISTHHIKSSDVTDFKCTQDEEFTGNISFNGRFWSKEDGNGADYWSMTFEEIRESIK